MVLKGVHEKLDEIPEEYRGLYTEKNGKFEITGVEGIKTQADVDRVQASLKKERDEHKATKDKLVAWGEMKPEDVTAKLARIEELEVAAKGKIDEAKLDDMANKRAEAIARSKLGPVERELATLRAKDKENSEKLTGYETKERLRNVHDAVRGALVETKALPEAHEDALLLAERTFEVTEEGRVVTKDGVAGVAPGLSPKDWLASLQAKRPHWWPGNVGGGSRGSDGKGGSGFGQNPWSAEHWNLTAQGAYAKQHGQEKAEKAAAAAGSKIGATSPPKKK